MVLHSRPVRLSVCPRSLFVRGKDCEKRRRSNVALCTFFRGLVKELEKIIIESVGNMQMKACAGLINAVVGDMFGNDAVRLDRSCDKILGQGQIGAKNCNLVKNNGIVFFKVDIF